jgi:7-cyano-7-deazaguanine synthase
MKKAIILLSGGQDSTTCLYWALKNFDEVQAIIFDYGQSHVIEIECAKEIAKISNVSHKVFNVCGLLASSSLIEHGDHNQPSRVSPELPDSFTPGRNLLFLTIAASQAASLGINDLVTGVCQTDYSGYPDCRKTTIDAFQNTLSLGLGAGDFRIHTPLMYLSKAQTWKLATDLGIKDIIINKTMTDYDGIETMNVWGRGSLDNPASRLRAAGYFEAVSYGWI